MAASFRQEDVSNQLSSRPERETDEAWVCANGRDGDVEVEEREVMWSDLHLGCQKLPRQVTEVVTVSRWIATRFAHALAAV